jgi:hypothetical protein
MNERSVSRLQSSVAWTGPLCLVTFFAGWTVLSHNYPPPDPAFTAQQLVTAYYARYRPGIMLGMSLAACFGMFYLPWTCLVSVLMMRREKYPLLTLMQLTGGLLTAWILVMCPCIWVYCAEAAGSVSPELIKTLHFVAWYIFNMTWMITAIQCVALGLFALMDTEKPAVFPRWVGGMSIGIGVSFAPLTVLPYFKSGPFAINGWWAFHLVVAGFGIFTLTSTRFVLKEINRNRMRVAPGVGESP